MNDVFELLWDWARVPVGSAFTNFSEFGANPMNRTGPLPASGVLSTALAVFMLATPGLAAPQPEVLLEHMGKAVAELFDSPVDAASMPLGGALSGKLYLGATGTKFEIGGQWLSRPPAELRLDVNGSFGEFSWIVNESTRTVVARAENRYFTEVSSDRPSAVGAMVPIGPPDVGGGLKKRLAGTSVTYLRSEAGAPGGTAHVLEVRPRGAGPEQSARVILHVLAKSSLPWKGQFIGDAGKEAGNFEFTYAGSRPSAVVVNLVDGVAVGQLRSELAFDREGRFSGYDAVFEAPGQGKLVVKGGVDYSPTIKKESFAFEADPGAVAVSAEEMMVIGMGRMMGLLLHLGRMP